MTSFRKMWAGLVNSLKPQLLRDTRVGGLHSIYVDTRPFRFQER